MEIQGITAIPTLTDHSLYYRQSWEHRARQAYLELDLETGELSADYDVDPSGVPASVFHRCALRWAIPPLTVRGVTMLYEQVIPLARKLWDDATIEYNGSNYVGVLGEIAEQAEDEIERVCESYQCDVGPGVVLQVWEAEAYLEGCNLSELGLSADSTDDEIESVAKALQDDGRHEGVHVEMDDLENLLTYWREQAIADRHDELEFERELAEGEAELEAKAELEAELNAEAKAELDAAAERRGAS